MDDLIAIPMAQRQQRIQDAVQEYGKRLLQFIRSRVKTEEDAEDILARHLEFAAVVVPSGLQLNRPY